MYRPALVVTCLLFAHKVLSLSLGSHIHISFEKFHHWGRILRIKSPSYRRGSNPGLFGQSWVTYQGATNVSNLMNEPVSSYSSFSLPLPYLLSLFLSSSSSSLCHSCWWKDRDSTGHRRWKPLLPEWLSICSERQSGSNMHICLHV